MNKERLLTKCWCCEHWSEWGECGRYSEHDQVCSGDPSIRENDPDYKTGWMRWTIDELIRVAATQYWASNSWYVFAVWVNEGHFERITYPLSLDELQRLKHEGHTYVYQWCGTIGHSDYYSCIDSNPMHQYLHIGDMVLVSTNDDGALSVGEIVGAAILDHKLCYQVHYCTDRTDWFSYDEVYPYDERERNPFCVLPDETFPSNTADVSPRCWEE